MDDGTIFWIGFTVAAIIAGWVMRDARKRGMNSAIWGVGTLLFLIVVLPIYLIVRKPIVETPSATSGTNLYQMPASSLCATCGKYYAGRVGFCPNCGAPQTA